MATIQDVIQSTLKGGKTSVDSFKVAAEQAGYQTDPSLNKQFAEARSKYSTPVDVEVEPKVTDLKTGDDYTAREAYVSPYAEGKNATVDEAEIRRIERERIQERLDALEQVRVAESAELAREGAGRVGQQGAVSTVSGGAGSDFANAQREKVVSFNRGLQSALNAKYALQKQALLGDVDTKAQDRIDKEIEDQKEALKNYIADISRVAEMNIKAGVDYSELDEATKAMLDERGVTEDIYTNLVELEGQPDEAQQPFTVAKGASVYDPATGTFSQAEVNEELSTEDKLDIQKKQLDIQKLQESINNSTDDLDRQVKEAQLLKLQTELQDSIDEKAEKATQEPFKSVLASNGRQSINTMIQLAKTSPGIFGRTASAPTPDMLRSDAYRNYEAQLDALKGNIIPAALGAMRDASKTGGALGQVSDREGNWLAASLGALNMNQSPEQVLKQLKQIDESLARWQTAVAKHNSDNLGSDGSGEDTNLEDVDWANI